MVCITRFQRWFPLEHIRLIVHLLWKHRTGEAQQQGSPPESQDELMNLMTIMYIAIQETLNDPEDMSSSYGKLRT